MYNKLKAISGNLIFSLNILILFLLFFEGQLSIPTWIQAFGRLHPMFLHFPIVLLLLGAILEVFRFNPKFKEQEFYLQFTDLLFIAGLISVAVTVLMGFILSVEESYTGEQLEWHKWFGVSLVFLSSFFYMLRGLRFYNSAYARAGTLILFFVLIMTGHYGAVLTHGENFVTEPILNTEPVPLEESLVFDHVIQPVFQQKCVSCHSDKKLKGSLKLTDTLSILKGGKSGKLFIAGKPNLSLLLERIHLPPGEKKHMPPSGKPQLTEEESRLLYLWVKSQDNFKQKLIDLPPDDSLRMLAESRFKPLSAEVNYSFEAADIGTIQKLNNFYRRVELISRGSPAISVSFFNKSAYSASSLEELKAIKDQIVSLRLSRMPVKDEELQVISTFKNLEKLDLNFTDISTKGVLSLIGLTNLKSVSLSGTSVKLPELKRLLENKGIKELTIWNTSITDSEIQLLRKQYPQMNLVSGYRDDGSSVIQLSKPVLKNNGNVFSDELAVNLYHPRKSVSIRYTLDGSDPDSLKSKEYDGKLIIKGDALIKTKAFKDDWKSSETAEFNFFKSIRPKQTQLLSVPNENYKAAGAKSLFDAQLADKDPNNNNWLGFMENELILQINLKQPFNISRVGLNTLISSGAAAFPPHRIRVYGGADEKNLILLGTLNPVQPGKFDKPEIKNLELKFPPRKMEFIKVVAEPLSKMPSWHVSKGKPALLLVDEVLLN